MYMNTMRGLMLGLVLVVCGVIVYAQMTPGFSIREFLGLSGAKTEMPANDGSQTTAGGNKGSVVAEKGGTITLPSPAGDTTRPPVAFKMDEIQQILALADQDQRKKLLDDQEKFKKFVQNEASAKSIYAAIEASKFDQNEKSKLLAKRGAENVLREMFVRQLIASKIPPEFPSSEQIRTYYEKNKGKFVLEERLPVWQIFLPIPKGSSQKEIELLKKQAETIISEISMGKIDFTAAAGSYSGHKESKYNGGYMGIVRISDMKPEIGKALLALEADTISSPIQTEEGIHILKHGLMVPRQELKLVDVQDRIKQLLLNQARTELRQAIYRQAETTYPVDIDDKRIEEWRLKMRINFAENKPG